MSYEDRILAANGLIEKGCERIHLDSASNKELLSELVHSRLDEEQCIEVMEFIEVVLSEKFNRILKWEVD